MCDRMRQDDNAFKHAEDVLEALRTADNDDDRLLFIRDTLLEGYRWRKIATYFAEVHAANAEYLGSLKSTSTSNKRRFKSICERAAEMLRTSMFTVYTRQRTFLETADRCAEAAERIDVK